MLYGSKRFGMFFLLAMGWIACSNDSSYHLPKDSIFTGYENLLDFPLSPVIPAVDSGAYAHALADCIFEVNRTSFCTLDVLPFLGMETVDPSIDDVMSRVIVAQPWMADNFRQVLEQLDNNGDFQLLARALTAIVISDDIRPSFYRSNTGAIYIDPAFLWLNEQQFRQISQKADFRSNYGSDLQFVFLWRWVKNNAYATRGGKSYTGDRTISDIEISLAGLMYHELAHANDFIPPNMLSSYTGDLTPGEASSMGTLISEGFASQFPLQSNLLRQLAEVSFHGVDATAELIEVTANDFADAFTNDFATHYYNYSTILEDFAMTFDSMMLLWRFGVQQDIGVTPPPYVNNPTADDYRLVWGQRQRVADPIIREKARYAIAHILPEVTDADAFIDQLEGVIDLNAGDTWAESIDPTGRQGRFIEHPPVQTLPPDLPLLR